MRVIQLKVSPVDTHYSQPNASGLDKTSLKVTKHHSYILKLVEFHKYVFRIKVMHIGNTKVSMT